MPESSDVHILRKEIQHLDHLAEDQNLVALLTELGEELVQEHHLTGCLDVAVHVELVLDFVGRLPFERATLVQLPVVALQLSGFDTIEKEGVVTALAKFHLNIHELRCSVSRSAHAKEGMVVLEDGSVILLLDLR